MLRGEAMGVPFLPAGASRSLRTSSRTQRTQCFVYVSAYFYPKCTTSNQDPSAFLFFDYFAIEIKVL